MRKIDIGGNRTTVTGEPRRYVPFVDRKSCSRIPSRLTSIAQCERETSGSSTCMSAPPPLLPIVVSDFVMSNSVPGAIPKTISSCARSATRSSAFAAPVVEFIPSPIGPGFSRESDDDALIVFGPESRVCASIVELHIQHRTTCGASCGSSK